MDEVVLAALTTVELREASLLAWGAVGAEWSEQELLGVLSEYGQSADLLKQLLDAALVVRTPSGGYRSRSAETVRLIATLRQVFRGQRASDGKPLVLDYRFLHRPRRRPRRDRPGREVLADLRLGTVGTLAASRLLPESLSGFQERTTKAVLAVLGGDRSSGVMVTAGTGAGKTLAFYLPMLAWLADNSNRQSSSTRALALYPRNELLKDQLRVLLGYIMRIAEGDRTAPTLSLATWFGPTPANARAVREGWADGWTQHRRGFICPFLRCLNCDADLLWLDTDLSAGREVERLVCARSSCDGVVDGRFLRLTRESARQRPGDLMLSTTESLNRQLSTPGNLGAFGVRPATLAAVLLDEVHTYEGTTGAQNAILLRRLTHALGRTPVWVGLSATLRNAGEFFARFVGLQASMVTVVSPDPDELVDSGAEYLLAVRSDPHSKAGTLSTTIQTCMALARSLDVGRPDPFNPPPSSSNVFGSRLFAFTDKLDSTNRLFWSLLDAEGWSWPGRPNDRQRPLTLAHVRAETQRNLAANRQEPPNNRDSHGSWWWLAELLGHGVDADRQLRVDRVSSQDRGVAGDADIVVATATLEVGFDDDRVGAVVQHKAPHDAAQFLQRKGRAGRNMRTRPWTVVVLSDWGRDRQAWEAYDALFDPDLPPRNLPIENLYVLRIQSVYALMDWLAVELRYAGRDSTWVDLTGPASALSSDPRAQQETERRQRRMSELLARLLRPGPERERLRRHLRNSLGLGGDALAESIVDSILWESPRPLLLAVVPTMRRRLADQWLGEEPAADDVGLRTRTPMRSFVPGNLFDDLLVPDVELRVPGLKEEVEVAYLPALRALREFTPGNVTRHFGVWASNKRHWIPLPPPPQDGSPSRIDLSTIYDVESSAIDTVNVRGTHVPVFAPKAATLEKVPTAVRDYSSVQPDWEFCVLELGNGQEVSPGRRVDRLLKSLIAHLHIQGGGTRIIRFARTAHGTVWAPDGQAVALEYGVGTGDSWRPAAVGVDVDCDALTGVARQPEVVAEPTPDERASRLRYYLLVEMSLSIELSAFDRGSLSEVVLLAVARARLGNVALTEPDDLTDALLAAAETLGFLVDHDARSRWESWCRDPNLTTKVLLGIAEVSSDERSAQWWSWWRRRYTLSVAHIVVTALAALCPGVDSEELMIDLCPDEPERFWVSEPSPGGTGQIEAFVRLLAQEPQTFARGLEEALMPTSVDTMDEELVTLLRADSPEVRTAIERLRDSWSAGHGAVARSIELLVDAVRSVGLVLGGPARSALSTRLAGPGAHPGLLDEVVSWLELRDAAEDVARLGIGARTLGGLLAQEDRVDNILHLGSDPTESRRARAIENVLWPRGDATAPVNLYGPYLEPSFAAIRTHVDLTPSTFYVAEWNSQCRSDLHNALREYGEVVLSAKHDDQAALRTAVVDLQVQPVEVGALLCHPVVVGERTTSTRRQVRMLLREAGW